MVTGDPHVLSGKGEDGDSPAISADEDIGMCARNGGHEALQAGAVVVSETSWRGEGEDDPAAHGAFPELLSSTLSYRAETYNLLLGEPWAMMRGSHSEQGRVAPRTQLR